MICDLVLFMYHLSFILRPLSYRFHLLQCIIVYHLLLLLLCMTIISISCIFTTVYYHCLNLLLSLLFLFFIITISALSSHVLFEHVEIGFCADIYPNVYSHTHMDARAYGHVCARMSPIVNTLEVAFSLN